MNDKGYFTKNVYGEDRLSRNEVKMLEDRL